MTRAFAPSLPSSRAAAVAVARCGRLRRAPFVVCARAATAARAPATRDATRTMTSNGFELSNLAHRRRRVATPVRAMRDGGHARDGLSRSWMRVTLASAIAIAVCYADRSNMSTAIIALASDYELSKTAQGAVLSAFFYGYGATQIVGGSFADAYGGKWVLLVGCVVWSCATLATPAAADVGTGVAALVGARVILGAGEGVAFPAVHAVISRHVPVERQSTAVAVVTAASYAGAAVAFAATPPIVSAFGWRAAFYSFGGLMVFWLPLWLPLNLSEGSARNEQRVALDDDDGEGAIDVEETRRLTSLDEASTPSSTATIAPPPPSSMAIWRELIKRQEVKAICVAQFAQSWGMYGLLSWLPTYFHDAQGVELANLAAFTFVPYILQGGVGLAVGVIADDFINTRNVPTRKVRQWAQGIGMIGPALALVVAASPVCDHNPTAAAITVDIGLALSALTLAGVSVSHLDIAPKHAGLVFATGNTCATLAGIVGVPLFGVILDATDQSWPLVFASIAAVYIAGAYYYINTIDVGDIDADVIRAARM